MKIAVYPGSFDPITYGHLDIIERASHVFDKIIVAVLVNSAKNPLFSIEKRKEMIVESTKDMNKIEVDSFEGLLVNYVFSKKANIILRGLRAISDFEYELQIASINRKLSRKIETLFLMTNNQHSFISSNMVKEVAKYGADIKELVPPHVEKELNNKFKSNL